jgi:sigma-B regulation protein RsbU (phosphoserine phosphatase)
MRENVNKSKNELIEELTKWRKAAADAEELRSQLETADRKYKELEKDFNARNDEFAREREKAGNIEKALRMSQLIVDQSPVILFRRVAGEPPKLEYLSENIRQFGYSSETFINEEITFKEIVHPDDTGRVGEEVRGYAKADVEEYTQFYRIITKSGETRWVADRTSVVRDDAGIKTHNQGILIDITERKQAEDALRKSEEKYRRIVETTGEGFILLDRDLRILDVNSAYCRMLGYTPEELKGRTPFEFVTDEQREHMLLNKDQLLSNETREYEGAVVRKDGREVPILVHGNTLRDDEGTVIGNMAFVTDITEHKKALMLAGEVQKSMHPHEKPQIKGLDIAGRNVSCDEIGGDYYDFLWQRESTRGPLNVVVGDISGHGVDSALLMTTARAFLRMRASQPGTLSEIISAMNSHLALDVLQTGKFMTLFFLSIDPRKKCVSWVRAGHDPAILYDPDKDEFDELVGSGIALGVTNEVNYAENHKDGLANGQILAIGTDGIWEAFNRQGEMYGKERLRSVMRKYCHESASTILSAVYDELNLFTLGQRSEDDITLVIIKVDGLD